MFPADIILTAAVPLYLGAACWDIAARIIPDRVPVALLLLAVVAALAGGAPLWSGLVTGMALFLALAIVGDGALGGGDVKLAAASVVLLGADKTLDFLLLTALAGGVLAVVYMAAATLLRRRPPARLPADTPRGPRRTLLVLLAAERRRIRRGAGLPYGVAIGAGALLILARAP